MFHLFLGQADSLDSVREAKEVTNRAVREAKEVTNKAAASAQRVGSHQSYSVVQSQARDADVRALADLSRALDKKVKNNRTLKKTAFLTVQVCLRLKRQC